MKCRTYLVWVFVLGAPSSFLIPAVYAEDKPEIKLTAEEQKILDMTNKERADAKLPPLMFNATLVKVARAHSANMAKQGKMEHELDGKKPSQRLLDAGYDYQSMRENIAWGEDWPVDAVMKGWMESEKHRENILSKEVDEVGIGVASDGKGKKYYTVDFGKQLKK
jgi:uncharacterized protein YkwD